MRWATRPIFLTPAQASDLEGADELLPEVKGQALLADKGYDADQRVREVLDARGIAAVIPPKANRKQALDYDRHLYGARHVVENFFAKLKQYRAIATRYDKRSVHFLGAIYLVSSFIWLA